VFSLRNHGIFRISQVSEKTHISKPTRTHRGNGKKRFYERERERTYMLYMAVQRERIREHTHTINGRDS